VNPGRASRTWRGCAAATLALFATTARAAPAPENVATLLAVFDRNGSGDRDGRIEWTDLDAEALAARFATAGTAEPERTALVALSRALGARCPVEAGSFTASDVRCVFRAVAATGLVETERLGDQIGAVRTDSLRGIHDGADPPASEPWLFAHLVLNGMNVPTGTRVQSGFERGFPIEPDEVAGWFPSYLHLGNEVIANLSRSPSFVDAGPPDARVSIRGRTSSTLHEAVSSPAELDAEGFRSPGMLFLYGERLDPSTSLVETGVRHIDARMKAENAPPGGFLLVTYGANDLFTFRQILIGAPEVTPARFEEDLGRLDRRTASLVAHGVRRIYVLPPPVDTLFASHVLPRNAHFVDGTTVPEGSTALEQWWLAAAVGRRLPRQDVLLPAELAALRARQDELSRRAARVLSAESNWLVVDTRDVFRALVADILGQGITVEGVPGYGALRFHGSAAALSTDGVHPSPFGYLVWAEIVLEALRTKGLALRHATPVSPATERTVLEQRDAVVARVAAQVRASPSFFRPSFFPFEPTERDATDALLHDADAFDGTDPAAWSAAYARSSFVLPFVPDALLSDAATVIDPTLAGTTLLHHEIVGRLRRVLEGTPAVWTPERRAAYRRLLVAFVEKGRFEKLQHARLARSALATVGMPDDDVAGGFERGHTPGVFTGERVLTLGLEAVARADTRAAPSAFWGRAVMDDVPYRTPPSFMPLGVTDFLSIEGHVGLAAMRSTSSDASVPAVYVEAWYTPLAFTAYFDTAPDVALTVELPSFRPVFGFGGDCTAFSSRCSSLLRFSDGIRLSFWPHRDPAFRAGPWPEPSLYAGLRGTYAMKSGAAVFGGGSLEGSAGVSIGF
jgi:hypothetical protein